MNELSQIIYNDAENIFTKIDFGELSGKKIIITGASGLLGNYFLACLKKFNQDNHKPVQVIAITQKHFPDYLKNLIDYNNIEIISGDLSDDKFVLSLPMADYIIHAAGYGQPGKFLENPVKTIKINTSATLALFEKLLPNGKFLFLSSSEVYSGLPNPPFYEEQIGTTNTTHPRACYIEAKRCGETICNAYRSKGIMAKSARLSLAYGPGTKPNDARVLNNFIYKALQGEIKMLDRGDARRTYCYITDAIEILWLILFKGKEPVYNVGGFSKTTIAELAKKIGEYLNAQVIFPNNSSKSLSGAPEDVFLEMSKTKIEFNKTEYVDFNLGLKKTIEWQKILYSNINK